MLLYIAGPLTTSGMVWDNVRKAIQAADRIYDKGHHSFIPHLSAFQAVTSSPRTEEEWMDLCFQMLSRCDALFRLEGESRGSDREVLFAQKLGLPVYESYEEIPPVGQRSLENSYFSRMEKALKEMGEYKKYSERLEQIIILIGRDPKNPGKIFK